MKILWVKTDFLHPTTRGGQIRTLEMVKRLHARHELHYATLDDGRNAEGRRRAGEYSSKQYTVPHIAPPRRSLAFAGQVLAGTFSRLPVAISRFQSDAMRRLVSELIRKEHFDSIICDFLVSAVNFDDVAPCVVFQHNVETIIWQRHAENAPDPLRRAYFGLQAKRMFEFERDVCRKATGVVAVSESDARLMESMFGVEDVRTVPTGVDVDYFVPRGKAASVADLVFVGSMDWMPNSDGMLYFVREVLPLIRAKRPNCTLAIVGRDPGPEISAIAAADAKIQVTGTVPDVRPYLWGSAVSIVPLRIGGGTRLKIYEAMAARTAVVSTTVGAEGLAVRSPEHIRLADTPAGFAETCLEMLDDAVERDRMVDSAWNLVSSEFSWDRVVQSFESSVGVTVQV
jgi:glycosyltransferase involved in cell wall biosynthesis